MAVDGAFGQAFLGRIEEGALVVRVDLVVGALFAHADEEAGRALKVNGRPIYTSPLVML